MDRPHERLLGTILVVIGLAILLFTLYHDYGLLTHIGAPGSTHDPQAAFSYSVAGSTVSLTDTSQAGSAPITTTYWSYGDGDTSSSTAPPAYTYADPGTYNVTLIVEDSNGNSAESVATITVGTGHTENGAGSPSFPPGGNLSSVLGGALGGDLGGIASTVETFLLLAVMWLVGGTILKAGWNLISPKAETIQVRVRPKSLAVEGVGYSAMPAGPAPAAAPAAVSSPSSTP